MAEGADVTYRLPSRAEVEAQAGEASEVDRLRSRDQRAVLNPQRSSIMTFSGAVTADEHAILAYLTAVDGTGYVSLRGMLAEDKADLPREDFDRDDWGRWVELWFAAGNLLARGMVDGIASGGGDCPNRFQIADTGRALLAHLDATEGRADA